MNDSAPGGRRTQIIAMLRPASNAAGTTAELMAAGMDVARLNFSHASREDVARFVRQLRGLASSRGRGPAILADLRGAKLRIGDLAEPRRLVEGDPLVLTNAVARRGPRDVVAPDETFAPAVAEGELIFLQDGVIELQVAGRSSSRIETVVRAGGELTSRAGLSIPRLESRTRCPDTPGSR